MIIKVLQLNCQKKGQTTLDILDRKDADIILLQEPYIVRYTKLPKMDTRWIAIYNDKGPGRIRAVTYIRKESRVHRISTKLAITNDDMVAIKIGNVTIVNIYNQKSKEFYKGVFEHVIDSNELSATSATIIAGDYNLHHPEWKTGTRPSKFTREVVEWLHNHEMVLCSPKDVSTWSRGTRESVIDLVYATPDLSTKI
jgi:exonuclease III